MLRLRALNYSEDLPEIIELIKNNLDDNYSESFFKWKHMDNPFGLSYGLLAIDQQKIIGLRMFMYWELIGLDNGIQRAIRPVDTVIDSSYRGRGIFKELTLKGLKECKGEFDLIFNTPNQNSLPGYLKMGWNEINNSGNFKIGLINLIKGFRAIEYIRLNDITDIANGIKNFNSQFITNKTTEFLKWRYNLEHYRFARYRDSYVIYSISRSAGLKSLIIYELLGNHLNFNVLINSLGLSLNAFLVYYFDGPEFQYVNFIKSVFRQKAVIVSKSDIHNISDDVDFSLGDLEGKI